MSSILEVFLNVVAPVGLIAVAGYLYSGWHKVEVRGITDIIIYLLSPCLILKGILSTVGLSAGILVFPAAIACNIACLLAISFPAVRYLERREGRSFRGLYLPVILQNSGNMGIPMCTLAFGDEGMRLATLFFASVSLFMYSLGVALAKGGARGIVEVFRLPLLYALGAGIAIQLAGWTVPKPILVPIDMLGQSSLPLMLFALGCQLREVRLTIIKPALVVSLLRLGGGYVVARGVAAALSLDGVTFQVFMLISVMPAAVMNFALAEKYGANPHEVSGSVLLSTLLSILVIPIVLATL